jgi:hypothetical protein
MEIRSCRVTIADMDGVAHTVEVMAARLFEAVALGLKQLQGNEWVAGIGRPMDMVTVAVKSVPGEHHVRIGEFTKWLERSGITPAEVTRKRKVREILAFLRETHRRILDCVGSHDDAVFVVGTTPRFQDSLPRRLRCLKHRTKKPTKLCKGRSRS